jgi:hypothetical protein
MHSREQLEEAGKTAAPVLRSQEQWIHRRVETISFPSPEEPVYRRHVSVDFTIPDLAPVPHGSGGAQRYYVPLSFVRKWPPLLRLDLRNGKGEPIPFLTGSQNAALDGALLHAVAEEATTGSLDGKVKKEIEELTTERDEKAAEALRVLLPPLAGAEQVAKLKPQFKELRADMLFVGVAGGLRDSTFLWLRVEGEPGDREIVKFAYDIPMTVNVGLWSAASFGFRPFVADFGSPHIGSSSSYHLTISTPAPLRVVDTEIRLIKRQGPDQRATEASEVVASCSADSSRIDKEDLTIYTEPVGDQGRFYITGERSGCTGEAQVALIANKGLARSACLAATLIAALLSGYAIKLHNALEINEAAVTLALVAPALLAYLLVRPAQHEFVRSFTTGIRRTLGVSGLLPILGATAIVLSGGKDSLTLRDVFLGLVVAAWALVGVLSLSAILPIGDSARPFSSN